MRKDKQMCQPPTHIRMNVKTASMPTFTQAKGFPGAIKKSLIGRTHTHKHTHRMHTLNESTHGNLGHKDKSL